MKPIKLEIEGLHSFSTKQVIDFTRLTSRGVFGIFGATGSGKSTILDAIILALYGKVHRSKTNADFINLKSKKAVVSFEFSYAENGVEKEYRVIRTFKRKPKNDQEVDQIAEVYEIGGFGSRQIVEGANKVDNFIANLIGMSDAEFCKCIALPQGEFASFLKAKPNERVNIIGNIFDLNKYGQELWDKVKNRLDAVQKDRDVVSGKLEVLGDVDPKKLGELKQEKQTTETTIEAKEKELDTLIKTEASEKEVAKLCEEKENLENELTELEKTKANIKTQKVTLDRAKTLLNNKYAFDRIDELNKMLLDENDSIYVTGESLKAEKARTDEFCCNELTHKEELNKSLEKSVARLERLKALKQTELKLVGQKAEREDLRGDREISVLKIDELKKLLNDERVEKGVETRKLKELDDDITTVRNDLNGFESVLEYKSLSAYVVELKSYQDYLSKKHSGAVQSMTIAIENKEKLENSKKLLLQQIRKVRQDISGKKVVGENTISLVADEINEQSNSFAKLKEKVSGILALRLEIATKIKEYENREDYLENEKLKLDKKIADINHNIEDMEIKLSALREEKYSYLSQNGLADVIDTVKIGDECPVCRAEVMQKANVDSIDLMVIDKDIQDLETAKKRCEETKDNLIFSISKIVTEIEACEKEFSILEEKDADYTKRVKMAFNLDLDTTIINEDEKLKAIEDTLKLRIETLKQAQKLERELIKKLHKVEADLVKQNCILALSHLDVETFAEICGSLSSSIKDKDTQLLGLVSEKEDIKDKLSEMQKLSERLDGLLKSRNELVELIDSIDNKIKDYETKLAIELKTAENLETKIADIDKLIKQSEIEIGAEVSDFNVLKAYNLQEKEIEGIKYNIAEIDKLVSEQRESIQTHEAELNSLVLSNKAHMEEHKRLADGISKILKALNIENLSDAKLFLLDQTEIDKLSNLVENYEKNYEFAKKRLKEIDEKLDGRVSSETITNQLALQISELNKQFRELRDNLIKVNVEIEKQEELVKKHAELTSEYQKLNKEFDTVYMLYDALKGKALLEFIAEEFIDDISYMASNKLQVLMDGRYVLKYEDKEFFVIDNFNDGSIRPVSTLSGGELFVVSLALALSISDAIATKSNKSIDFFFLDEGFGTLDKEYCEYIVDSLIKLESQNLVIGLISHIPELQERIAQKLEVYKGANGSTVKLVAGI